MEELFVEVPWSGEGTEESPFRPALPPGLEVIEWEDVTHQEMHRGLPEGGLGVIIRCTVTPDQATALRRAGTEVSRSQLQARVATLKAAERKPPGRIDGQGRR